MGLLLLRALVGGAVAVQGGLYLANVDEPTTLTWGLGLLALASGTAVLVGFLTPGTGAVAGVSAILIALYWSPSFSSKPLVDGVSTCFVLADSAALILLGPGALSMDAYLFGRREIVIPHEPGRR
jgi:hypothetical protein